MRNLSERSIICVTTKTHLLYITCLTFKNFVKENEMEQTVSLFTQEAKFHMESKRDNDREMKPFVSNFHSLHVFVKR